MKNLTVLAAEINCYKKNEMPAHYFENEYFAKNFEHGTNKSYDKKEVPAFLLNMPNIEVGIFFEVRRQNVNNSTELDCYYIEHSYIFCKHKDSDNVCLLREDSRSKKFSFMPNYTALNKYNSINSHARHEVTKNIKEPNLIGVFTEKKVIEWLNYCNEYLVALNGLKDSVLIKINEAQISINEFIAALNGKCKVSIWQNTTTVETAHFTVNFKIDKTTGYFSNEIQNKCKLTDVIKIANTF
jgi:hypothetical protein